MRSLALDSSNNIYIENNSLFFTNDGAEVAQNIRCRLLTYKGEWFLSRQTGVPYFEEILTKPANLARVESILKTTILQTGGVKRLISFSFDYDSTARGLTVNSSIETIYDTIEETQVKLNV